ncbi:MAG: mannose-1-phosphate guanylyltransferase [Clostridia bacterium]|nr:mannose-1-phosphate guanylyltransferase [Clostridia bacterium]
MKNYLLIMSGGKGSRLWPISTEERPKQFLNLYGNEIMINETIRRVEKIYDFENIFIITNKEQEELAYRYIDARIPRENIIIEPAMRNTAMAIFYGTTLIREKHGDGTVAIFSSDHYIDEEEKFQDAVKDAINFVEQEDDILTIGIEATYPATRFGYIKYLEKNNNSKYYNVIEFKEKPNKEKAIEFIESKQYTWNSGMFFGKTEAILNNFEKYLPNIYKYIEDIKNSIEDLKTGKEQIEKIYSEVESISIDRGILEKSDSIKMLKADFGWNDVGDLKELFNVKNTDLSNNSVWGNCILNETENTNIYNGEDGIVITLGVSNISVVKNNNICLVCDNNQINKIPEIYQKIKDREEYKRFL